MIVKLHTQRLQTLDEIRAFLLGMTVLDFDVPGRKEAYGWIEASLRPLGYRRLGKVDKGLVRSYLIKVSGFSPAQITRLLTQYRTSGRVRDRRGKPAHAFQPRYRPEDVSLLAEVDTLHGTLSGLTSPKICERSYTVFADPRFERLAHISNGQIYNLRHSVGYQRQRTHLDKTRRC